MKVSISGLIAISRFCANLIGIETQLIVSLLPPCKADFSGESVKLKVKLKDPEVRGNLAYLLIYFYCIFILYYFC